jgi:hypothetical protein
MTAEDRRPGQPPCTSSGTPQARASQQWNQKDPGQRTALGLLEVSRRDLPPFANGLGMGMALTVTADTILASVPRDRTGAASAISETATELGGALGMAVLGSILIAAYRTGLVLPAGLPAGDRHAVEDSLGAALSVAGSLPAELARQVADTARHAFVEGMHVALVCGAGLAALFTLRGVPKVIPEDIGDEPEHSDLVDAAKR